MLGANLFGISLTDRSGVDSGVSGFFLVETGPCDLVDKSMGGEVRLLCFDLMVFDSLVAFGFACW